MVNRPKIRGTAAETAVVNYLERAGWIHAERRALHGNVDKGDVAGIPQVCIEVKDCKSLTFGPWLKEALVERDNAGADVGAVWAKRRGHLDPKDWFVVMDGDTFTRLLREAGY
jgi:hypothetical protein